MKKRFFQIFFILIMLVSGKIFSQDYVKTIDINIETPLLQFNDEYFLSVLDSDILNKELNTEWRTNYIYLIEIEKDSIGYLIEITLTRPTVLEDVDKVGFFRHNCNLFLVKGINTDNELYSKTHQKEILSFRKKIVNLGDKVIDYDSLNPEEYPSWLFHYSSGRLKLLRTEWVPE